MHALAHRTQTVTTTTNRPAHARLAPHPSTAAIADGDNPDPAEVHGFVGLGSAAAALEEGVQRCTALLAVLGR